MFVSGQRDSASTMPIQAVKISLWMAKDTSLLDFFFLYFYIHRIFYLPDVCCKEENCSFAERRDEETS